MNDRVEDAGYHQPPVVALEGPTASGKSQVAIQVAEELNDIGHPTEIVNADSMLVYRGMDIGTAKPTPRQRGRVAHHLIDIMDVSEPASVALFQAQARDCIARLRSRGVIPLVVGGSSLYMRAILDEFIFPGTDPAVRAHWQAELDRIGAPQLHAVLAARAPEAAADILPGNGRRIVRALEVLDITGQVRPQLPEHRYALTAVHQIGLDLSRTELDARIQRRVAEMWRAGFVDEVRRLDGQGLRQGLTASRALGYRQILSYLDGETTEREAQQATIAATRRFARKQLSWLRRDPRIIWLSAQDDALVQRVVTAVREWAA